MFHETFCKFAAWIFFLIRKSCIPYEQIAMRIVGAGWWWSNSPYEIACFLFEILIFLLLDIPYTSIPYIVYLLGKQNISCMKEWLLSPCHWSDCCFIVQFGNYERSYPGCQFWKISDRSRVLLGLKSSSPIYIEMIIWNNFGYIIIHRKSFPLSVPMVPVNKNTPPAPSLSSFPQKQSLETWWFFTSSQTTLAT